MSLQGEREKKECVHSFVSLLYLDLGNFGYFVEIEEMAFLGLAPGSPIFVPLMFALVLFDFRFLVAAYTSCLPGIQKE